VEWAGSIDGEMINALKVLDCETEKRKERNSFV
jgi:hypothetical protein